MKKIDIVVPCYNEEKCIELFYSEIKKVFSKINNEYTYKLIFVDDGSNDNTLNLLKNIREKDNNINIISFSKNFGKEAAIYAGLKSTSSELVCLMDADLQHPPQMIPEMLEKMKKENLDVVATKRKNRKSEKLIKSFFSKMFYKIMKMFVPIEQGTQDFRIMKKYVVEAVLSLEEYNRFSKGIFSWCGFNVQYIPIDDVPRKYGDTKWSIRKLFKYAVEGITSFTTAPLKLSIVLGIIISFVTLILAIIIVLQTLIMGKDVPGYASIIVSVLFVGGIQLLSLGILSEYISKMYLEIKARPKYIIKEKID